MSADITTGIEMELWVIDEYGRLCDGQHLSDAHDRIKPEFVGPLIEVQTEPHDTVVELRYDLREVLSTALIAATAAGKQLVPLGTPLTAADEPANCERGRLFEQIYGDGIVSAKNCAGTHVHFAKRDVVQQLNLLTAIDPALALVSSSPYYLGQRSEDSSRAAAYRSKCGPEFRRYCDLWNYATDLTEWEERIGSAYEEYLRLGAKRGISVRRIEDAFDPENTVLNPVRLRYCQPTVEWRAPDSTLPSQVLQLVADVRNLVDQLETKTLEFGAPVVDENRIRVPEFPDLRQLSQEAIEDGLGSEAVRTYLRTLGFEPNSYQPISQQLYGPPSISESTGRELRLEYARRFREDVRSLSARPDTSAADSEVPQHY